MWIMHEVSLMSSVIDMVEDNCKKNNINKATKIILKIGEFYYIEKSYLIFAFEALSKNGICEGAKLEINEVKAKAYCKKCQQEFSISFTNKKCPKCNCLSNEIISGYEMLLYRIEGE